MNIRPLDLLDLPSLARYRNDALMLDAVRAITRGNPLSTAGFLSHFNPARHVYTAITKQNGDSLLGSVIHTPGESHARLLYLAPSTHLTHPEMPLLIEHLAAQAGTWSAFHVIAEVDETSNAFPALRSAGFAVYAWQRMWDVSSVAGSNSGSEWKRVREVNIPAVQSLYHQIVPPLLQPIEPPPRRAGGFICSEDMKCHVSPISGALGIVLTPLVHPDATGVESKLASLLAALPDRRGRPVYLCVRSYQTWLEPALEDLGAKASARQAVMVKHLARLVKEEQAVRATQPAGISVQPSRVSRAQIKK
ncbi:MAG: hypothetical protein HFACDABA_02550 [Anaerolineales bacterium]|nr:hypothetical protein [Anaerolineales bacterium]